MNTDIDYINSFNLLLNMRERLVNKINIAIQSNDLEEYNLLSIDFNRIVMVLNRNQEMLMEFINKYGK